ncbi:MAG: class I SAM-dependent methyltransferase [gamma proteobacterium symbiont of Bathyaustriella thionipta]|nr:class I SAM-dependent methyltransferase [gamma proteobacterium symbiont of Bathyaustriella thionipta]MCU7951548.1 class I SAM-dependent methyltransferase [gamma proteobacterium symbiont of Bathyaustriella thionipta]MCU7953938.1 class I SAM-dependent methyltransferase [gamma proteobacterium symbiont of Bathyaustriella thionipta]MCU7958140.1 class I SAM-dependent methyltransferase [gamma proteobacterium symbiont of Bathyaustriella thionipta]MCU7966093.1 class I SAM-dependent methyltransferase 
MALSDDPKQYNDWYYSKQGAWLGQLEYSILSQLMQANNNATLLDIGCGTGYFSRQFSYDGLSVTGVDPASSMIEFAMTQKGDVRYIIGDALALPCTDNEFDYCSAITSLCFINEPQQALLEMWRVSKKGLILGLLNRHSLLYLQKSGRDSYAGARWDSTSDVLQWIASLKPEPSGIEFKSVYFLPGFGILSKKMETFFGRNLQLGGFLAVSIHH